MIDLNNPPELEGYQFSVCCNPWRENGNDFMAFSRLPKDRLALVIADFLGFHTVPEELKVKLSTETQSCLVQEADLGKAVERLNTRMFRGKDDERFIMYILFVFEAGCRFVSVVNAGHHSPLVYRAISDAVSELMASDRTHLPLGVVEGIVGYEPTQFTLCEGDTIAAFTDGIPEAVNSQHRGLSVDAIKRLMAEGGSVNAIRNRIMKAVVDHVGTDDRDDMTLAVFRYIGSQSGDAQ